MSPSLSWFRKIIMDMDATQALKTAENALRDFISAMLFQNYGAQWFKKSGLENKEIERAEKYKKDAEKKPGTVEERIIYYCSLDDLKKILTNRWDIFKRVFDSREVVNVWLNELSRLRDHDSHRRELLPYQKNLIIGLSGEIRAAIVKYRSILETAEDYFPRLESVRDNFGNMYIPTIPRIPELVSTKTILRPQDTLEIVVTASDPKGEALEYSIEICNFGNIWSYQNSAIFQIKEKDLGGAFDVYAVIRSPRKYYLHVNHDDRMIFRYAVLPTKF